MKQTKCAKCLRYFTSTTEFDAHRTGPFGHRPSLRRCLTDDEMTAKGWATESARISDETGTPERRVYFRPAQRAKAPRLHKVQAATPVGENA